MKTIKYILGVLALSAAFTSCVGDLNVTPIDPNANTADKALVDEASYQQFLAGVYLGFATSGYYGKDGSASISGLNGGASQYIRGLYHHSELTTWMNWTTDDTFIYAFYSRIFMQVAMANEFIREAKASEVSFAKKQQYIDEARVLRALAYYHAIDNFGNTLEVARNHATDITLAEVEIITISRNGHIVYTQIEESIAAAVPAPVHTITVGVGFHIATTYPGMACSVGTLTR